MVVSDLKLENPYAFPLGIQLILPQDYQNNGDFLSTLALLKELGFSCIELNIEDPRTVEPEALKTFLSRYGLTMTMFASGYSAIKQRLNLSDENRENRYRSVESCLQFIDFAAAMGSGIIFGLIQGAPVSDPEPFRLIFRECLETLVPYATQKGVRLLIEATNKSLTSIANSIAQTKQLIHGLPLTTVRILADTYHMHFEEDDMIGAMIEHIDYFDSIHYSDDNRFFPGLGNLDFAQITENLKNSGFKGFIVLEANIQKSLEEDLRTSMDYLGPILAR
jgi:D-psicose/D-tagatose/L-ribulose 3-epimerase